MNSTVSAPSSSVIVNPSSLEDWQSLVREQRETIAAQSKMIEALEAKLKRQDERIQQLESEIKAHKKLKGKPNLSASKLNSSDEPLPNPTGSKGSKRHPKQNLKIDEERLIQPDEIPAQSKLNGYRTYDVQELVLRSHTIRFRLAEYVTLSGELVVGKLPVEYQGGHYGPQLVAYILYQYYQCRVTQPLIYEQLRELSIEISTGQISRILTEGAAQFIQEQSEVLQVGLATSIYIHTDDTGARHQGKNGYCTVIGNDWFTYFKSSESKSRRNFLEMLQGETVRYVLNDFAREYLTHHPIPEKYQQWLQFSDVVLALTQSDWERYLLDQGIVRKKVVQVMTESALLGGILSEPLSSPLRILSDGARQFNIMIHGLCWVHAERAVRRLQAETENQRQNLDEVQSLLWGYYRQLKDYQQTPRPGMRLPLTEAFDSLFGRCYLNHDDLNKVLNQFTMHKTELLQSLNCPEFPLHNNAAEQDIREYVTRRKISGGTRSDAGRKARDTLIGLKKTCRKLGISFWQFLLSRLRKDDHIPSLSEVIRAKSTAALQIAPAVI